VFRLLDARTGLSSVVAVRATAPGSWRGSDYPSGMAWWRRRRPSERDASSSSRDQREATTAHLRDFATTRVGVEAYIEPANHLTQTTIMLVATDGEWTRRKVPDPPTGVRLARELGIPVYDVQRTGYPQRVRDWNARRATDRPRVDPGFGDDL
jgi:hypothetical protein